MTKIKTVSGEGKLISFQGNLKLLSERKGLKQKVEVWLLNDEVNRNNWKYINLEEHKNLFVGTPILVAYKGNKIGDGHNFEEVRDEKGEIIASFMDATAERVVGYFKDEKDIRFEIKDGKQWIVGVGYIWKWYAQELVKKLEQQGFEGMSVSIETLIDEMYMEGTTEVFTKYQILGTTILGDDVNPAVAGANIRTLSALGVEEVRNLTLRVASQHENKKNPQKNMKKGVKSMNPKELEKKFNGYTVLAVDGENVALLSEDGGLYVSTFSKNGDEVVIGEIEEAKVNAVFAGEQPIEVPATKVTEVLLAKCTSLEEELKKEREAHQAVSLSLSSMQSAENARRKEAVKNSVTSRFAELQEANEVELDSAICDEVLTEEKIASFAEMEDEEGKFTGDKQACKELDSRCMSVILDSSKAKRKALNSKFAWEIGDKEAVESKEGIKGAVDRITE